MRMRDNLLFYDLETTGVNPWKDRIVSIRVYSVSHDFHLLVNPEISIPEPASRVHGITDEMVRDLPTFRSLARTLHPVFVDKVLVGYNSRRFDTVLLHQEFRRAGLEPPYDLETVQEIDVYQVWHHLEPRTLSGALKRWTGRTLENAHDAGADVQATLEVFAAMREHISLEDSLQVTLEKPRVSRLILDPEGVWRFNFGTHFGKACLEHADYLKWMLSQDFDPVTLGQARDILSGIETNQKRVPVASSSGVSGGSQEGTL